MSLRVLVHRQSYCCRKPRRLSEGRSNADGLTHLWLKDNETFSDFGSHHERLSPQWRWGCGARGRRLSALAPLQSLPNLAAARTAAAPAIPRPAALEARNSSASDRRRWPGCLRGRSASSASRERACTRLGRCFRIDVNPENRTRTYNPPVNSPSLAACARLFSAT